MPEKISFLPPLPLLLEMGFSCTWKCLQKMKRDPCLWKPKRVFPFYRVLRKDHICLFQWAISWLVKFESWPFAQHSPFCQISGPEPKEEYVHVQDWNSAPDVPQNTCKLGCGNRDHLAFWQKLQLFSCQRCPIPNSLTTHDKNILQITPNVSNRFKSYCDANIEVKILVPVNKLILGSGGPFKCYYLLIFRTQRRGVRNLSEVSSVFCETVCLR